jgi:hypothetical protein
MIKTFHRRFIDISKESGTTFDCKTCKQPNGKKYFASNFVSYMASLKSPLVTVDSLTRRKLDIPCAE